MKSIEQSFSDALEALEASGKKQVAKLIRESKDSIERKLASAEEALDERGRKAFHESQRPANVRKNLGANQAGVSTGTSEQELKESIVRSLVHGGMSEVEAKLFADVGDNQVRAALKRKDSAAEFWEAIKREG